MNGPGIIARCCIVIGFALGIAACGGGGGDGDQSGAAGSQPAPVPSGIGAAGGTVLGPNGSKVEIPSGALAVVTQIAVDQTTLNAPPLPAGLTPIGQMFAFTPHGTSFAVPATITMPFDPASVPGGATPALFKTNSQNQWERVADAAFGASNVTAPVSSFSHAQVVTDFLTNAVHRQWRFSEMINTGFGATGTQSLILGEQFEDFGGDLVKVHDFGATSFDSGFQIFDGTEVVQNGIASGVVASAGDIRTFQLAAEAPRGNSNVPGEILGSETELIQEQTFLKQEDDASLTFTMPLARIELHDENAILGRICPADAVTCDFIQGQLEFDLEARTFDPAFTPFFHISSIATLSGFAENWRPDAQTTFGSHVPFWNNPDFELDIEDINGTSDSKAVLRLIRPLSFNVDISKIKKGESFHVRITAHARAYNRLSGAPSELPTSAGAYINFEQSSGSGGGGIFTSSGLEQVNPPADVPDPPPIPLPPLPCPGGVNPAAGVLQFSAATYTSPETDTPPTVTVTRTGGSTGAVSATLTTIGGTATADSDFEPVNATVFFADGDTQPRVVEIPIVEDAIAEGNETVELELSQPGGCVRIGAQDTAILTIVDDDVGPGPSGLDGTFSGDGKATLEAFGGDRSGMAVQPDGKVIMVGGSFTSFIMARFDADGTLDDGFGDSGRVTIPIIGSQTSLPQEANAVAVQRDGKIVVVGNARTPNPGSRTAIAIVRFDADGNLDDTFGTGGFVFGPTFLFGRAFAVAIDGEDRIVVAGDTPVAGNVDFGDFIVARFQPDGDIDTSFGEAGIAVTDVGGVTNEAHGLKVFSDNSLLVSGFAPQVVSSVNGTVTISEPLTAVVRYREDGTLDDTFDTDGRVALPGDDVGRGLAVQTDGRIVLAGSIETAVLPATLKRFALMRLLANGTIDGSFGNGGRVQTAFTQRGDAAFGVALQADGKIVAAGASNIQVNSNFAVARYESDGDLDTTFTDDGLLTIDFFGFTDVAENVAIQSNGKIVLGGLARNNVDGYGVARVLP